MMSSIDTQVVLIKKGVAAGELCNARLAEAPWEFDLPKQRSPIYGPGSSQHDTAPNDSPLQGVIPQEYRLAPAGELEARIWQAKEQLGERLVMLGHHYQRDEVIQFCDYRGDSFKLAQQTKNHPAAEFIIFCGVHFMAETADILSLPDQAVILPNLAAGCSMADMASSDAVEECWEQLSDLYQDDLLCNRQPVIPVTYVNSSASLKAFCGKNGGIACTSSNAESVLTWAFERGQRVLFFPDQHLGRNTAKAMGVSTDQMPLWDPRQPLGGSTPSELSKAKAILWRGWCSVHKRFTIDQIERARREYPGVRVLVHPECPMDVVDAADEYGSTERIIEAVESAPSGTTWGIGTEVNLVKRLANEHPDQTIFCLDPIICPCSTMYRIHPAYLCWVTEALVRGEVLNQIKVPEPTAEFARVALERMLAV